MLETVAEVVKTDRWNSFDKFHDTTRTLVQRYEQTGAGAEVFPVQTGGRIGTEIASSASCTRSNASPAPSLPTSRAVGLVRSVL